MGDFPTATAWVTVTPPPGAGLLFSIVSTLISRCLGDTYLISGDPTVFKVDPNEIFPPGVYGSSKSSSFWSL